MQPSLDHLLDRRGDARIAVAHRVMDADVRQSRSRSASACRCAIARSGEPSLVQIWLYASADFFGRVRRMMPCRIGFHASGVDFDHAPVAQEFGEIAPDGARLGRVGRAEVDQQHADLRLGDGRMVGRLVMPRHRIERQRAHALARCRHGSRWRRPARAASVPSPLMPPGASLLGMISTTISGASPRRGRSTPPIGRARGIPATHSGDGDRRLRQRPDQRRLDLLRRRGRG